MLIVDLRYTFFFFDVVYEIIISKSRIVIFGTPKILLTVEAINSHVKTMRLRRSAGVYNLFDLAHHKWNELFDINCLMFF